MAFNIYDLNKDGRIQKNEIEMLIQAYFQIISVDSTCGVTPNKLAEDILFKLGSLLVNLKFKFTFSLIFTFYALRYK